MSRLKSFLRRSKKSESSEEDEQATKEEDESKPLKPTRGWRRVLAFFMLYFPLGKYQRALDWHLVDSSPPITNETNETNESTVNSKVINIREKSFRSRFGYFCSRTILQSVGLSIVITAPISLPWIFNVVIPFSIDLLPFGLSDIIREIINGILVILSPLEVVVDIIMVVSNVFGTVNPIFFYGQTLWMLKMLGITDIDVFEPSENSEIQVTESMVGLLANHYQSKFALVQSFIAPLLILLAFSISFFLIIRSARSILFEIQSEKEQMKNIEKVKRTLIGYYLDEGYSQAEYTENRIATSTKLKWLARITKYGPIVSVILPISLAIIFVIL